MIQEFKDFVNKGGVFEAAIGFIFALAFKPIIDSLVADVILPIVGAVFGVPSFADLTIGLGVSEDVVDADGTVTGTQEAAIGLVFALAFKPIIDSLVADVILPIVGAIFGVPSFADLSIGLGVTEDVVDADGTVTGTQEAAIRYGSFLDTIISFTIIAFVLFMLIKAYNKANKTVEEEEGPSEVDLLVEIRDNLKR